MPRLRFNAFSMNCVSHIHHGQWTTPGSRNLEYKSLDPWIELAQLLERGKFDALFLADVVGTYDSYGGDRDAAVEEGLQIPVNDPSLLIPAMALATENLGFAFTQSILQEPPFNFARRLSTLDHLTGGRVGWNIVTSYLRRRRPQPRLRRAAEPRGPLPAGRPSTSRSSTSCSRAAGRTTRSSATAPTGSTPTRQKIHEIDHVGEFYDVVGPHLSEPSPQRTPTLFQAGSSEWGRDFAARNAEGIFIIGRSPEAARKNIDDVRARAARAGRDPGDILFFQGLSFVVGGTEDEARRKAAELDQHVSPRGYAAHIGGGMGVDLSEIDPATPIGELEQYNAQGVVKGLIDTAPDKDWTFGDLLAFRSSNRVVGTPEQIADELELWAEAGSTGSTSPTSRPRAPSPTSSTG